jgi:hypothetical protein
MPIQPGSTAIHGLKLDDRTIRHGRLQQDEAPMTGGDGVSGFNPGIENSMDKSGKAAPHRRLC